MPWGPLGLPGAALLLLLAASSVGATLVAVGGGGTVLTSPTGSAWTPQAAATLDDFGGVAPSSPFVLVGAGGTVQTSPAGTSWMPAASATAATLRGVATNGVRWVAVGEAGTIVTSTDGVSWSGPAPLTANALNAVATDGSAWIAVGDGGTLLRSLDGVSWSLAGSGTLADLRSIAFGDGTWVAVGTGVGIRTSADGLSWAPATSCCPNLEDVQFSGEWVAVGLAGVVYTSPDAVTWTGHVAGTANLRAVGPPCDGSPWVAVGDGGEIRRRTGPTSWVPAPSGTGFHLDDVACRPTPPAPLACAPASVSLATGGTASFAASGGTPPYAWTLPGAATPGPLGGGSAPGTYGAAGAYTVHLSDAGLPPGYPPQSASCSVTVSDPPPPSCSPAATAVTAGHPMTWTGSGGTGSFVLQAEGYGPVAGPSATFTFETPGTYEVSVTDTAPPNLAATCLVEVWPPPVQCGPPLAPAIGASATEAVVGQPITFLDLTEGDVATRTWEFGDGAVATLDAVPHAYDGPGGFVVQLTVQPTAAHCPASRAQLAVAIRSDGRSAGGTPGALEAWAGEDQAPWAGAWVQLAGAARNASAPTFAWSQVAGPTVALEAAGSIATFRAPALASPGILAFELRVADGGQAARDWVLVHVAADRPPEADAGGLRASPGGRILLDGSASFDPDGSPLRHAWTQVGGPPVELIDADKAHATVVVPEGFEGELRFLLEVGDGTSTTRDLAVLLVAPRPTVPAVDGEARAPRGDSQGAEGQPAWSPGAVAVAAASGAVALLALATWMLRRRRA